MSHRTVFILESSVPNPFPHNHNALQTTCDSAVCVKRNRTKRPPPNGPLLRPSRANRARLFPGQPGPKGQVLRGSGAIRVWGADPGRANESSEAGPFHGEAGMLARPGCRRDGASASPLEVNAAFSNRLERFLKRKCLPCSNLRFCVENSADGDFRRWYNGAFRDRCVELLSVGCIANRAGISSLRRDGTSRIFRRLPTEEQTAQRSSEHLSQHLV